MATKKKIKKTIKSGIRKVKKMIKPRLAKKVVKQALRVARKTEKVAVKAAKFAMKQAIKQAPAMKRQAISAVNTALAPAGLKLVSNKKLLGEVSHFFDKICVAVIEVKSPMKVGDRISIEGPQTNFTQTVNSIQVEHDKIQMAKAGQSVGMKVANPVRKKDLVYLA
ncbi:MAG TPA: hypothetical protein HA224_01790 [Nanoarchaeota archaeon]|nr:hypothetical protein [Nanoarchaeota archaeon]